MSAQVCHAVLRLPITKQQDVRNLNGGWQCGTLTPDTCSCMTGVARRRSTLICSASTSNSHSATMYCTHAWLFCEFVTRTVNKTLVRSVCELTYSDVEYICVCVWRCLVTWFHFLCVVVNPTARPESLLEHLDKIIRSDNKIPLYLIDFFWPIQPQQDNYAQTYPLCMMCFYFTLFYSNHV